MKHQQKDLNKAMAGINPTGKNYTVIMAGEYGAYMSIWYGILFSVLEGLKEEGVIIDGIEKDIEYVYEPLRLYRNAVFHPQKEYWSHKFFKIMQKQDSVDKIWKIHKRLGEYFLEELNKRRTYSSDKE